MENSFNFIIRANEYLDNIKSTDDKIQIESHILELSDMKKEMERRGFKNPNISFSNLNLDLDISQEESADLKKQLSVLKYYEYIKRITLLRVKIALSSFLILRKLRELDPEIIPHLPIDGNHISRIIKSGKYGLNAFTRMNTLLSGKDMPQYLIAKVEYEENGKRIHKSIRVIKKDNLEERIKKDFGKNARVIKTRIVKQPGLITSDSARISIILSFVSKASQEVKQIMNEQEQGKIREYNELLRKNKLIPDSRLDLVEGFENVKSELIERNFLVQTEEELTMDEELKSQITKRNSLGNLLTEKKAIRDLLLTIYKFYILNSKTQRQENNLLPTLTIEPEESHLEVFNILEHGENKIENATKILKQKLEYENLIPRMDPKIFGASFFVYKSNNMDWGIKFFNISNEDLTAGINEIKLVLEKGRGKEFLEAVRDADS
ncbi:DUF530 domain-containing protein [Candidatus Micrarchaeota archaeon]|nr:DUF530 domain-containing protein [Candidatus Micrarchaeota archaeon]